MATTHPLHLILELDVGHIRRRLFEIIPGFLSWGTMVGLGVLAFVIPFWIAIFVIIYDVYVLIRAVYMSIHLIYAYRHLRHLAGIDWLARCRGVSGDAPHYYEQVQRELTGLQSQRGKAARTRRWQLTQHLQELEYIRATRRQILPWSKVHHLIVLPTYNEPLEVLRSSLTALRNAAFPLQRVHVVVGFEERVGPQAKQKAATLEREFGSRFGTFLTTMHPDGLPGERRVKSANATWAIQQLEEVLAQKLIPIEHIIVSNFDSDTAVSREYFAQLTYVFITHPDRYRVSYQPLPMYNNNVWDAPAFSRVIATGSTFWQMIESTRPERLVTFSSHSMTLKALKDVGYWQKDIISEDSRIFWQCLLHYDGNYRTQPLYTTLSMDAALAGTWWQTFKNQYKQKRRWAWGIENFPHMAEGFWRNARIPRRIKWQYTFRTLEGHYSWTTTAIIVAGLGWLPVLFGDPVFQTTVLSYSLPSIARTIMTVAMVGLLVSTMLTLQLLPPKPATHSSWRYVSMTLQWVLVPLIATALSAIPALDAETRLLLGRDLEFNVMQKIRKTTQH